MRVEKNQNIPNLEGIKDKKRKTKFIIISVIVVIMVFVLPLTFLGL